MKQKDLRKALFLTLFCSIAGFGSSQTLSPVNRNGAVKQSKSLIKKPMPFKVQTAESQKVSKTNPAVPYFIMKGQQEKALKNRSASPAKVINPATNVADSILLYGFIYNSGDWTTLSPMSSNFYSFHFSPEINYENESSLSVFKDYGITNFFANDKFYTINSVYDGDNDKINTTLYVYDPVTWKLIDSKEIGDHTWNSYFMSGATYDPITDKAYVMTWGSGAKRTISSIDLSSYKIDSITESTNFFVTLSAAPDGKIYGISDNDSSLYSLDLSTKQFTALGNTGIKVQRDVQSAAIDRQTNKMYWVGETDDYHTHLYTVDMKNGNTKLITDMPNNEKLAGLYIPYANDDAPACPTGIKMTYDSNASTSGTLSFKVPNTTYKGKSLSGGLTAYITIDGNEETATVTAGSTYTQKRTMTEGLHKIAIQIGNSAGKSPLRKFTSFTGNDVPAAVKDVNFALDENKVATVTWEAPTASKNGGYLDESTINYQVIREPNDVVVSNSQTTLSFTEQLTNARGHYYYKVIAMSGSRAGDVATTNVITSGNEYVPPFKETFDTEEDFGLFSLVTNNDIGFLYQEGEQRATWAASMDKKGDDYFISPAIVLGKSHAYKLTYDVSCELPDFPEKMVVSINDSKDPLTAKAMVLDTLFISNKEMNEQTHIFNVPQGGNYYLTYHVISKKGTGGVYLDNIAMVEDAAMTAPNAVKDLKLAAGAKAALNDTISFTTPTTTYNGNTLASISKVVIYKGENATSIKEFNAPKTGEKLSFVDTDVEQGLVTYHVVAFNADGKGKDASMTNYVGLDTPAGVSSFTATQTEYKNAVLTWTAPQIGMNKGYINPSDLQYTLYRYNSDAGTYLPIAEKLTGTTYTDKTYTLVDRQDYVNYAITASNAIGVSEGTVLGVIIGKPYETPYRESFTNAGLDSYPWTTANAEGTPAWDVPNGLSTAVKPYDKDGGMLSFANAGDEPATGIIISPRVSMKGSKNPVLSFYMFHGQEAEPEDMNMRVLISADDAPAKEVLLVNYNNDNTGWERHIVSLKEFQNADNVIIRFKGYAYDASAAMYLDNIQIDDQLDTDMAITGFAAPARLNVGTVGKIAVEVLNKGSQTTGEYKVELFKDKQAVASQTGNALAGNKTNSFSFDITAPLAQAGETHVYAAKVTLANDEKAVNDNSADVNIYMNGPKYPKVTTLSGKKDNQMVTLNWNKPSATMQDAITDNFDSYTPYIITGIGDWTTLDGDSAGTYYFTSPTEIANEFQPQAWQVWNRDLAGFQKFDVLLPHSGTQFLASWGACDDSGNALANDNWLISTDVVGGTDLSFFVKEVSVKSGPEQLEVLYSTTDKSPENFKVLDKQAISTTDWTEYAYTLPEDAKYFALRSCAAQNGFVMLLDDVSYTPLYGSSTDLELKGFNVYRDNALIASNISDTTYIDKESGTDSHVYRVSTIWNIGESMLSNEYVSSTGVGLNNLDTQSVKVFAGNKSIVILNGNAKIGNIYTTEGGTVFSAPLDNRVSISVPAGIYLVRVDSKVYKVYVK